VRYSRDLHNGGRRSLLEASPTSSEAASATAIAATTASASTSEAHLSLI
jgi:hypothetical protein